MQSASRPWWQQVTALVSVSVGGAVTGFSFVPHAAADITSPAAMPIRLLALERAAQPQQAPEHDAALRSAIVNVANHYLRMAQGKTPAEMEAIIWQHDSADGADHGASCAAFASLTLELAARAVGQHSWVTGGTSYPWPLHKWADVRVQPNPASPGITSVLQDAQAHHRWHPLGSGYQPQPGDWVLFEGHVEVVTQYDAGVLHTVGGDSLPNFSVNAHTYPDPLGGQGVLGFVNNGTVASTGQHAQHGHRGGQEGQSRPSAGQPGRNAAAGQPAGDALVPGAGAAKAAAGESGPARAGTSDSQPAQAGTSDSQPAQAGTSDSQPAQAGTRDSQPATAGAGQQQGAEVPGPALSWPAASTQTVDRGAAAIPGMAAHLTGRQQPPAHAAAHQPHHPAQAAPPAQGSGTQQAFISEIAPGAIAAQREYGVPASVTIAQAIVESGWGHSELAARDHNLFGIKGTGPAGRDLLPTQEYVDGQLVDRTGVFRVYNNAAESISDHGRLLATSGYYRQAMARRHDPNAFAASLTGVYATDPRYGDKLITLMCRYDLYRYDASTATEGQAATTPRAPADPAPPAASVSPPAPGTPAAAVSPAIPGTSAQPADPARPGASPAPGSAAAKGASAAPGPTAPAAPVTGHVAASAGAPAARGSGPAAGGRRRAARPSAGGPDAPRLATPTSRGQTTAGPATAGPAIPGNGISPGLPITPAAPAASAAAAGPAQPAIPGTAGAEPADGAPAAAPATARTTAYEVPSAAGPSAWAASVRRLAGPAGPQPGAALRSAHTAARSAHAAPRAAHAAPRTAHAAGHRRVRVTAPQLAGLVPPQPEATGPHAEFPPVQLDAAAPGASAPGPSSPGASETPAQGRRQAGTARPARSAGRPGRASTRRYQPEIPPAVRTAFTAMARVPLLHEEPLYRDVASETGIRWELLAACDWMQCKAQPRHSPVHGEKLGTVNPDGSVYRTRSEALAQCADDLVELAHAVYQVDITAQRWLSVRELAKVFAAFRWGGLLKLHRTSAMEFPYSVAGLTIQHLNMRWPGIDEPHAPDKPGGRFRMPFGAVPIVLCLSYPATV